jgi:hypothetical protein
MSAALFYCHRGRSQKLGKCPLAWIFEQDQNGKVVYRTIIVLDFISFVKLVI